ncbi:MAG: hypothetical protein Tsb0021_11270 [Chlamydiales bacterium]
MIESVNAIVLTEDQSKVLLVRRRDVPDLWTLPGGGIELSESPEAAAIREVYEESGVSSSIIRKTGYYTPVNRLTNPVYVFLCRYEGGAVRNSEETCECRFFSLNELPEVFHVHMDWMKDALDSEDYVVKEIYQVTYIKLFIYMLKHPLRVFRIFLSRIGFPLNTK